MLKEKFKKIIMSLIGDPTILIIYWVVCYELASLCMYGRYNNNIYIFMGATILLVAIIIFKIIRVVKSRQDKNSLFTTKTWQIICVIIIILITSFYGFKVYKSAINYNGKLSWAIQRLKTERHIKFKSNNIYKDGVNGIFKDLDEKYELPQKLYMSSDFSLKFKPDGTITSFETFVYGKNKNNKYKSFLISYEAEKSKDMTVILDGFAGDTYDNDKLIDPLVETVSCIPIKEAIKGWDADEYGLLYKGKRNWGYNTDGIYYVTKNKSVIQPSNLSQEIVGYTVSIYVPGEESTITPHRYNLLTDNYWMEFTDPQIDKDKEKSKEELNLVTGNSSNPEEFYLKDGIRYKLTVMDKAAGQSFYMLDKTTDGGNKWTTVNNDPLSGAVGGISGMYFIDETTGFIGVTRNGGDEGELYRTNDGGQSFNKIEFDTKEVSLGDGVKYKPYDYPTVPYEKDGDLYLKVEQGADGDYKGDSSLLYSSKDKGKTWEYVKEVNENPEDSQN